MARMRAGFMVWCWRWLAMGLRIVAWHTRGRAATGRQMRGVASSCVHAGGLFALGEQVRIRLGAARDSLVMRLEAIAIRGGGRRGILNSERRTRQHHDAVNGARRDAELAPRAQLRNNGMHLPPH